MNTATYRDDYESRTLQLFFLLTPKHPRNGFSEADADHHCKWTLLTVPRKSAQAWLGNAPYAA